MQPTKSEFRIVSEAARLLKLHGPYGIHVLCLVPDDVDESIRDAIQRDLSDEVHVDVRPLTVREWHYLLWAAGLRVATEHRAPMHLFWRRGRRDTRGEKVVASAGTWIHMAAQLPHSIRTRTPVEMLLLLVKGGV